MNDYQSKSHKNFYWLKKSLSKIGLEVDVENEYFIEDMHKNFSLNVSESIGKYRDNVFAFNFYYPEDVSKSPCDGCHHFNYCKEFKKACRDFSNYVGVGYEISDKEGYYYRKPSRDRYNIIFKNDKDVD